MTAAALPVEGSYAERQQPVLVAEIARMRALLESYGHSGAPAPTLPRSAHGGDVSSVDRLAGLFGLSDFELDVLLLAAAVELDGDLAALSASVQGGTDPRPTFGFALAALPDGHWDALGPAAPLRRWRLVELGGGATLATRPVRIDERVLHHLTGVPAPDDRLDGIVAAGHVAPPLSASQNQLVADLHAAVAAVAAPTLVRLDGDDVDARLGVAERLAETAGLVPQVVRVAALPDPGPELAALCRLLDREALLLGGLLILDPDEDTVESVARATAELLETPVVVVTGDGPATPGRVLLRRTVSLPPPPEQRDLWRSKLAGPTGDLPDSLAGVVEEIAAHYRFGAAVVGTVAREATATSTGAGLPAALRLLCRGRARVRLDGLAARIDPRATWDDLVLPEGPAALLHDIARQVRHRTQVYERWGFGARTSRGLGITALFAGESGTGKTLAAEVLAAELGIDLYRVDLAEVVNKYIGETEKNLRRVFDAAEAGGAVLLFDEADALFGRRGEVRDGHDRYANLEVAYLLQRMESYRGLAILTTNLRSALDRAFLRRLRFIVQFPFPDEALRAGIWRRAFPAETPCEGVDPVALARMQLTGGSIRAIALGAAFAAADDGTPVTPAHVLRAAQIEYAKHDRSLTDAERRGWA
jgi:hypothetical protein